MEFKEVIDKRRTIRDFKNKEVPMSIVEYAIANGFKADDAKIVRQKSIDIHERIHFNKW